MLSLSCVSGRSLTCSCVKNSYWKLATVLVARSSVMKWYDFCLILIFHSIKHNTVNLVYYCNIRNTVVNLTLRLGAVSGVYRVCNFHFSMIRGRHVFSFYMFVAYWEERWRKSKQNRWRLTKYTTKKLLKCILTILSASPVCNEFPGSKFGKKNFSK